MTSVFTNTLEDLDSAILDEITLDSDVHDGMRGKDVRRVQEWLNLHNHGVVIDGDFGPATSQAVHQFQADLGIDSTGVVDATSWEKLIAPMIEVLQPQVYQSLPFGEAVLAYARTHLVARPREIGGANRGPWVRLYMDGFEGPSALWCAGFTTFIMRQAADSLGTQMPIPGSFSCDQLAEQGRAATIFVDGAAIRPEDIAPGSLFLVRNTADDWTHTGIVVQPDSSAFSTIEGNTNDSGDREGYEVCARTRAYGAKDFLLL